MADENNEKEDQRFYDIDKQSWKENINNEHKNLTKELNGEITFSKNTKQVTKTVFNTRLK